MPNVPHDDPFPGGHFRVEIDGINKSNFDSVSGLTGFAQVEEYREGSDPSSAPRKEPGEVDYTNIVLRAGLDGNHELYDWWKSVADGEAARRNMSILLLDRAHTEVARWN